jgi:hypothetical protein
MVQAAQQHFLTGLLPNRCPLPKPGVIAEELLPGLGRFIEEMYLYAGVPKTFERLSNETPDLLNGRDESRKMRSPLLQRLMRLPFGKNRMKSLETQLLGILTVKTDTGRGRCISGISCYVERGKQCRIVGQVEKEFMGVASHRRYEENGE